jgi:hypothetical protein
MVKLEDSKYAIAAAAIVATTATVFLVGKKNRRDCSSKDVESWESHVGKHGSLVEIWPDTLFVLEASGCSMGPPVRNMAIYRVPDGSRRLVIYNGIAVDEPALAEIEKLGTPSVLVVPNGMHRCCAAVWKAKFPEIMVVCPNVAKEKVSEIVAVDASTQMWATMNEWTKWIHVKEVDGWCEFETVVEVELDSKANGKRAVLLCDLLFTLPPCKENAGVGDRLITWFFDSSLSSLPTDGGIVVPKVSRIARIFAIKDWAKAQTWYRSYAREHGKSIAAILVGHGVPVVEVDSKDGCIKALDGVADQLIKPRW